jgi:putative heme transporter
LSVSPGADGEWSTLDGDGDLVNQAPDPSPFDGPVRPTGQSWFRQAWPWLRFVLGLGILVLGVWVLSSHTDELSGVSSTLSHLDWWWLIPGVVVEMISYVSFTGMQFELLGAGHLRAPRWPLFELTVASQAMLNSLPAGTAFSAVYGFRWYRRFGADTTLAAWALVGTFVASTVSLSLIATVGLGLATGQGASLDLVPVLIGVLVVTVAVGALFVYQRALASMVSWSLRVVKRVTGRPKGELSEVLDRFVGWVTAVRLNGRQVIRIVLWGGGNWVFDCACFALMFPAVHAPIPWEGLLLAYGAGQLAANLPITPGGLGAVEGTITIALVAFGGQKTTTVAAVLMYRLISFWLILVIGWLMWGDLALGVRRGRWIRHALAAPVEAEVEATEAANRSLVGETA